MRQSKYTKIISVVLAICLLASVAAGIFIALPMLLPFLAAACIAGYFIYRLARGKRAK